MNSQKVVVSGLMGLLLALTAQADAVDELVPMPRRIVRGTAVAVPAALGKVTVRTGEVAGVPQHLAVESYRLEITPSGVTVTAPDANGVRYAKTTLAQLAKLAGGQDVPCCTIEDWPTYRWRGFMPDTARNFMPLPLLKNVVDYMAAYKLNLLHWHLTENYAWRLESKRYPQLQSKEAFLIRYVGDYYTQEDFKEMVRYCAERGVTIMPELDVPGHAQAFRRAFGFSRMTAHGADRIVADLFDELCTLATPEEMPFVHVGGDEVWKREMEGVSQETLGLWAETLAKNGRTLVRWDGAVKKDGKMSAPNEQFPVKGPWVGMQWCGHEGEIPVNPIFDANGMYIETKDPFDLISIALFHRLCPWTNLTDEMKLGGIFCGWHDGFVGPDHEKVFRNEPIVPSCVLFGEAFWCGEAADLPGNVTRLPPRGTPEFAAVVDLENRVIAQRDRVLRGLRHPFHFLRQSDIAWRVTDAETGRVIAADQPGATVRPLVRPDHPANLFTNQMGKVVMETWIRSPKTQKVGAWIGFTGMDRDHGLMRQAPLPKLGEWNRFGAKAELNGEELAPPKWQYAGMEKGKPIPEWTCWDLYEIDEKPYADHEYFMREPTPITLREGWNHVKLTLPMTTPVKAWWSLPWIGTFIPVAGTTDHPQEVPGLEYSAEPRN